MAQQIITRRKVRTRVFQALFAQLNSEGEPNNVFDRILNDTWQAVRKQEKPIAIEDDALFLKDLFYTAVQNAVEYQQLLQTAIPNWDISRVAKADLALILLGITEMVKFPAIPVSVSINEYIEISKEFSTEKSGTFINGVLDTLNHSLTQQGIIQKTGTGLVGARTDTTLR
jgi:transcription antitermination protein NusB